MSAELATAQLSEDIMSRPIPPWFDPDKYVEITQDEAFTLVKVSGGPPVFLAGVSGDYKDDGSFCWNDPMAHCEMTCDLEKTFSAAECGDWLFFALEKTDDVE